MLMIVVKQLWSNRGVKDGEHEAVKDRILEEYAKVQQKERITMIIHETYVKEIQRMREKLL